MSKRILVVEDQPDNRQIIRDMLAPTDYEITEAENGEEALVAIAKQRCPVLSFTTKAAPMSSSGKIGGRAVRSGTAIWIRLLAPRE